MSRRGTGSVDGRGLSGIEHPPAAQEQNRHFPIVRKSGCSGHVQPGAAAVPIEQPATPYPAGVWRARPRAAHVTRPGSVVSPGLSMTGTIPLRRWIDMATAERPVAESFRSLSPRRLFARCFQLQLDHEHVVPGQRAMVTALRDARG